MTTTMFLIGLAGYSLAMTKVEHWKLLYWNDTDSLLKRVRELESQRVKYGKIVIEDLFDETHIYVWRIGKHSGFAEVLNADAVCGQISRWEALEIASVSAWVDSEVQKIGGKA